MERKELNDTVEKMLPVGVIMGYGYYGATYYREGDKYYVAGRIGDTCD